MYFYNTSEREPNFEATGAVNFNYLYKYKYCRVWMFALWRFVRLNAKIYVYVDPSRNQYRYQLNAF